jgi:hypothetical protein
MIFIRRYELAKNVLAISKMNDNFTLLFYNEAIALQQKGA